MTGSSTLDPDNFPERPDRSLGRGHGVDALGPSDISDSGSDVVGGPGFAGNLDDDQVIHLDEGTTDDMEASSAGGTAGPDIGTDHIETIPDTPLDDEDTEFLSSQPPGQAPRGK